jgi:hypothetical protein
MSLRPGSDASPKGPRFSRKIRATCFEIKVVCHTGRRRFGRIIFERSHPQSSTLQQQLRQIPASSNRQDGASSCSLLPLLQEQGKIFRRRRLCSRGFERCDWGGQALVKGSVIKESEDAPSRAKCGCIVAADIKICELHN